MKINTIEWKLVPIKPTLEMAEKGAEAFSLPHPQSVGAENERAALIYRLMLDASPSPVDSRDALIERMVTPHSYAQEYEFRGDGGDYVPTDAERTMIEDAICGYLGELAEARAALSLPEHAEDRSKA